jgi:hypothetical protein
MSLLMGNDHPPSNSNSNTKHSPPHKHEEDKYPSREWLQHANNRKRKVSVHPLQCICTQCAQRRESQRMSAAPWRDVTDASFASYFPVSMSPSLYTHPPSAQGLLHCPSHISEPRMRRDATSAVGVEDVAMTSTDPPLSHPSPRQRHTNAETRRRRLFGLPIPNWIRQWWVRDTYQSPSHPHPPPFHRSPRHSQF